MKLLYLLSELILTMQLHGTRRRVLLEFDGKDYEISGITIGPKIVRIVATTSPEKRKIRIRRKR
jgi:hypothetical protein